MLDQLEGFGTSADFLCDAVQLVVENIAKSLRKNQWKDELLVLGSILGASNRTRASLDPRFKRLVVVFSSRH